MFDYTSSASPLFNGRAADFLEKVLGEEAKAEKLRRFTKYLKRFNKEMPWMWQSITGVQGAYEYKDLKDPYRFSDGGVLEIECLETLDFTVAGMFDIYRRCVVDVERMVQILPNNLREFQMFVYVQEIRNFVPFIGSEASAINDLSSSSGEKYCTSFVISYFLPSKSNIAFFSSLFVESVSLEPNIFLELIYLFYK